jgi:hypothetical protein
MALNLLGLQSGDSSSRRTAPTQVSEQSLDVVVGASITELLYNSSPNDFALPSSAREVLDTAINNVTHHIAQRNRDLVVTRISNDVPLRQRRDAIDLMLRYNIGVDTSLYRLRAAIPEMFSEGAAIYKHDDRSLHPPCPQYTRIEAPAPGKGKTIFVHMQASESSPSSREMYADIQPTSNKMRLQERQMHSSSIAFSAGKTKARIKATSNAVAPNRDNHSVLNMAKYFNMAPGDTCRALNSLPAPGTDEFVTIEDGGSIIPQSRNRPATFMITFVRSNENTIYKGTQLRLVYKGMVKTEQFMAARESKEAVIIEPTFIITCIVDVSPINMPRASGIPLEAVKKLLRTRYGTTDDSYVDNITPEDASLIIQGVPDVTTIGPHEVLTLAKSILKTNQWLNVSNSLLDNDYIKDLTDFRSGSAQTDRSIKPYTVTGPDFTDIDKLDSYLKSQLADIFMNTLERKVQAVLNNVSSKNIRELIETKIGASINENDDIRSPSTVASLLKTRRIQFNDILSRWLISCFTSVTSRIFAMTHVPPVMSHAARTALMKIPYCVSSKGTFVYELTDTFLPLLKHIKLKSSGFDKSSLGQRLLQYSMGTRIHVSGRSKMVGLIHSLPEATVLTKADNPYSHFTIHGLTQTLNFDKMIIDMCALLDQTTNSCFIWHPRYCIIVARHHETFHSFIIPGPRASTVIPTNHSPSQVTRIVDSQTTQTNPSVGYLTDENWYDSIPSDIKNTFKR